MLGLASLPWVRWLDCDISMGLIEMVDRGIEQNAAQFSSIFCSVEQNKNMAQNFVCNTLLADNLPGIIDPEENFANCRATIVGKIGGTTVLKIGDQLSPFFCFELGDAFGVSKRLKISDDISCEGFHFQGGFAELGGMHHSCEGVQQRDGSVSDRGLATSAAKIATKARYGIGNGIFLLLVQKVSQDRDNHVGDVLTIVLQEIFFLGKVRVIFDGFPEFFGIVRTEDAADSIKGCLGRITVATSLDVSDGLIAQVSLFSELSLG